MYRFCKSLFVFLCIILVSGCLVGTRKTAVTPQISTLFEGEFEVDPYFEDHKPRTIAVLPFAGLSKSKEGLETVRRGFYNHFSSLSYSDMEIYRCDRKLKDSGLTDPDVINKTSAQELGKILNVDAVIYGEVSNFDKFYAVLYSQVSVGAKLRMVETKSGHFLWSAENVARKHEGGISTTPVGVIATIVATAVNVRDIELLRACDDLFRDMVKTIPTPSIAEAVRPPVITLLAQDTGGAPRKKGDVIQVVMKGDPDMEALFDIGTFRKGIRMTEVEPGGYLGKYTVVPGDNVAGGVITAYLRDSSGNEARWIDPVGTVTIDTTPPALPGSLTVVGREGCVNLSWKANTETDLTAYRIYRSDTPLTGFVRISETEFNSYKDLNRPNFEKAYYKATAVDRAGNESRMTERVTGMAIAPGPTGVAGIIEEDTTWYAGGGPYIIEAQVAIADKTVLTVESGTVIHSAGPGIVVEGSLIAIGDEKRVITFSAPRGQEEAGGREIKWAGISFCRVKDKTNILRFCQIRDAETAIEISSGSPVIEECELTENIDGIKVQDAFSTPRVMRNSIHDNAGTGVIIIAGAEPQIEGNEIKSNKKGGLLVNGASPVVRHNTICDNSNTGVVLSKMDGIICENNIFDNQVLDMKAELSGTPVMTKNNWWGTIDGLCLLSHISGRIDVANILDGPYPGGTALSLPLLAGPLYGTISSLSYLTLSNSPYIIKKDVTIDNAATLYIEPGVRLLYERGASLVIKDGGIFAHGTKELPVVFTSQSSSPSAGDYMNAVRFAGLTDVTSSFKYCVFEYGTTALDVRFGAPDIAYCLIVDNSQSGIRCRNDAGPRIFYNTITKSLGTGGIECRGAARPKINRNNIVDNPVAIQCFSTIMIDARDNWWGSVPPDTSLIWGENINYEPWLAAPEENAYEVGP